MRERKQGLRGMFAAATAFAVLALAPSAQAGTLLDQIGGKCPAQPLSQPFKRWLDPFSYTLVSGGSFESGAPGWKLAKATVVSGNEPFYVAGAGHNRSLSLPAGSTATTPAQCASVDSPLLRFFARRTGGTILSTLKVDVLFEVAKTGLVLKLPVGVVTANTGWAPSLPMPVLANLTALLPGAQTPVAFQFTPVGAGSWTIDDVYLDPKRH